LHCLLEAVQWLRDPRPDARSRSQSRRRPDRLSFLHAVRVIRRKMAVYRAIPTCAEKGFYKAVLDEILDERVVSSRNRRNFRGVKRKMSNFALRPRHSKPLPPIDMRKTIRIVK
jgi:hypothetical protein